MYPLLLFTVIITVLSGPVEASNPFADLIVSDTPMDGTYSGIDGVLCQLCCLPLCQCIHAHMVGSQIASSQSLLTVSFRTNMAQGALST